MNESEKYLDDLLKAAIEKQNHIDEEPMIEEPIIEEPIVEEPVIEEPVIEEPVIEEPMIEEPMIEEPVLEEPMIEEPVLEEPMIEEPMIEEPIVEEPMIEEPVLEEPIIEESIVEEPVIEEPIIEEPMIEEPMLEEPINEEPMIEEPIIEEPMIEEPIIEEPIIEEPTVNEIIQDDEIANLLNELDHIDQIDLEPTEHENEPETPATDPAIIESAHIEPISIEPMPQVNEDHQESDLLKQISEDEDMAEINELLKSKNEHEAEDDDILKMLQSSEQTKNDYVEDSIFAIEEPLADEEEEAVEKKKKRKLSDLFKKKDKKKQAEPDQQEDVHTEDIMQGEPEEQSELSDALVIEEEATAYKELTETKAGKKSALKAAHKAEREAQKEAKKEAKKQKNSEENKSSVFRKIIDLFTEEVEDQAEEAPVELFQETEGTPAEEILSLDNLNDPAAAPLKEETEEVQEDQKNGKKKGKKEKTKKEKKPKKQKKPKKVREPEPPGKKLPRQHVAAIMTVCLSIGVLMFGISLFYPKYEDVKGAKLAYINGNYAQSYQLLTGHKLDDKEKLLYERSVLLYRMERKYQSYLNFQKMGMNLEALNALVQGIEAEDMYADRAQELSVWQEYSRFSDLIGQALQSQYQVTPEMAREWLAIEDKQIYSRVLYDYLNGTDTLNLVTPDGQPYETKEQNETDAVNAQIPSDQIPDDPVISGEEQEFLMPEPIETIQSVDPESL
ncbi:MAG: hypothetical protein GX567_04520 [Clostridia bacterium]|nr:hypothetical protein [Clostridia bacterium]